MIFITISERHLTQLVEKTTLISKRTENMKKTYINPALEVVELKTKSNLLLIVSGTTDTVDAREMMLFEEQ